MRQECKAKHDAHIWRLKVSIPTFDDALTQMEKARGETAAIRKPRKANCMNALGDRDDAL
jgi:hypothetical protein